MLAKSISGAAAAASPVFVEDTFSSYLYTGNGSTQTITNGIDLSGKGGLVWVKVRGPEIRDHALADTQRGPSQILRSSSSSASQNQTFSINAFNSNGFSVGGGGDVNFTNNNICSWTFRKQAKFFDVVTYTGNGSNRTIAHNLGSVPGCIIVKRTDTAADWQVYHRSLANTEYMVLNDTAAKATGTTRWNSTTPTSTVFSLGTDTTVNANGGTYVAYLFAHNAGGFGLTGTDNVISCGYATAGTTVNLGYEPQWVLTKDPNSVSNWLIVDNMRGMPANGGAAKGLMANSTSDESDWSGYVQPTSTGFYNGVDAIYIAIRRGPMKVPTSGTSVFTPVTRTGTGANTTTTAGFPVDMGMTGNRGAVASKFSTVDRLRGSPRFVTSQTDVESSDPSYYQTNPFDSQTALKIGTGAENSTNASGNTYVDHLFRRSPGFFDVVAYAGDGVSGRTVSHNLAAVPEMIIVKARNGSTNWWVYEVTTGNTKYLVLNTTAAPVTSSTAWNNTTPTSSVFTVGNVIQVNNSGGNYIAYLFATCPGVSKVGSYTGTGTTKQIDCGFTGGARFVLIKRTDSTGDWYVWDTARGIVAGNDNYLLLNSSAAEVTNTDYIDTYSAGFEISSTAPAAINANGGTFVFLRWLDMTKDKYRQGYTRSKTDAKRRGIDFLFTFEEWKKWWIDTGKWELRGRESGCYQMCRNNDTGPYAFWNVYCDTIEANSKLPHVGMTRPTEWSQKISNSLSGKPKSSSHAKSLAAARLGKRYKTPGGIFDTSRECEAATGIKRSTVMWRCKNNFQGLWAYA